MKTLKRRIQQVCILSVCLTGVVMNAQESVQKAPTEGLVGYFSFDKATGSEVICDSGIAQGNKGIPTNATISEEAKKGKSLDVNPEKGDSYVGFDVTNSKPFVFNGENTMSVATWIKPRALSKQRQSVLTVNSVHGGHTYYLEISENKEINAFIATVSTDGNNKYGSAFTRDTNHKLRSSAQDTWIHVAYTFNGKSMKLYVNGKLNVESTIATPENIIVPWSNQLYLGAKRMDGKKLTESQFNGKIDELYFYNRALSADEVTVLMNDIDPVVAQ